MAFTVPGFAAAGVACGIKRSGSLDLAMIVSDRPASAAAVFTRNRFPGAPVQVSREHLRGGRARAIVVNSGVSNVATGREGIADARRMAALTAELNGFEARRVQVASTGVIGAPLPMRRVERGIREAAAALRPTGWRDAARAIMTTDTRPKLVREATTEFTIQGIAKGSGMIMPDMATMLSYIATDASVAPGLLRRWLRECCDETFNRMTIDGETSTSDTVLVLANGANGRAALSEGSAAGRRFKRSLRAVCEKLTVALVVDGEGTTRLADVVVRGARSRGDAERAARKIANSVLVKTALFGADPNWGRIVQALGASGASIDPTRVSVRIGGAYLLRRGQPTHDASARRKALAAMRRKRVAIEVGLGLGSGESRVLTCDLGYEYVRINAEYTT